VGRYVNSPWARKISLPDAVALVQRVDRSTLAGQTQTGGRCGTCRRGAKMSAGGVMTSGLERASCLLTSATSTNARRKPQDDFPGESCEDP
jgi:hypothetical protein